MPPPKWRRQILQERIAALLKERLGKSGVVLCEMAIRAASEFEVWQADVGYVGRIVPLGSILRSI